MTATDTPGKASVATAGAIDVSIAASHPNDEETAVSSPIVPLGLFACATYAFKIVVDARTRYVMLKAAGSDELLRSVLLGEEQQRRLDSLRWGLILLALGIGFGVIEALGRTEITPGSIAILAGATGLGNIAFFAISRRLA